MGKGGGDKVNKILAISLGFVIFLLVLFAHLGFLLGFLLGLTAVWLFYLGTDVDRK